MQSTAAQDLNQQSHKIAMRLKFYFATLSCLGGLVLSAGTENPSIPVIAVFFAVFGFVFVDWLELFALPPIAAYAAMAVAALLNVSDFLETDAPGNHQMLAVARLLVFVQAILMLQRKSVRIFEQLAVFCLLELIVAAVFNDAISYGLLLIPIGIFGAWSLSLLSSLSATQGLAEFDTLETAQEKSSREARQQSVISVSAPESWRSMGDLALRLPRVAMLTLAPAVLLVATIFFYALPRKTEAGRVQNRGNALVGFSEDLELEQIGQMMQSSQTALRIYLLDRLTGRPYQLVGGAYLRGKVLERYRSQFSRDRTTAFWNAAPPGMVSEPRQLPVEYVPERASDQNFFDMVDVTIICESMRSSALFAVAPYHQHRTDPSLLHIPELWCLKRTQEEDWVYPRIEYRFGTHAFRSGIQVDLINYRGQGAPRFGGLKLDRLGAKYRQLQEASEQRRYDAYLEELLQFDMDAMPTVAELASTFVNNDAGDRRSDYEIAKSMERHFLTAGPYEYTLNLNAESLPGMDPIEQFLRVDRRGHCQYFASALAMMLRSQGIPSRLVVGYQTDEYNELGHHYVARQLHAHAWVEALIPGDQLTATEIVYGQPESTSYWLRLDPTPPAGRLRETSRGVGQVFDLARNIWDDYVVDMDAERQQGTMTGGGTNPMNRAYEQLVNRLSLALGRLRSGELGGGALAWRDFFSWQAAVVGGLLALAFGLAFRLRLRTWIRRRLLPESASKVAEPSIGFYAETLRQLERIGLTRGASQTPAELAMAVERGIENSGVSGISLPLQFLTNLFYQCRFGDSSMGPGPESVDLAKGDVIEHAHQRGAGPVSSEVEQALAELTAGVDSILNRRDNAEQAT